MHVARVQINFRNGRLFYYFFVSFLLINPIECATYSETYFRLRVKGSIDLQTRLQLFTVFRLRSHGSNYLAYRKPRSDISCRRATEIVRTVIESFALLYDPTYTKMINRSCRSNRIHSESKRPFSLALPEKSSLFFAGRSLVHGRENPGYRAIIILAGHESPETLPAIPTDSPRRGGVLFFSFRLKSFNYATASEIQAKLILWIFDLFSLTWFGVFYYSTTRHMRFPKWVADRRPDDAPLLTQSVIFSPRSVLRAHVCTPACVHEKIPSEYSYR